MTFGISDLRERPEFFDTVADRIWQAWWQPRGVPLDDLAARLAENLIDSGLPIALIAHRGDVFLGTASLIASDLDERPALTPWVAAVWTEPEARSQGVGRGLIARACDEAFALGHSRIYLCAPPLRHSFYMELEWMALEDGIGDRDVTLFAKDAVVLNAQ